MPTASLDCQAHQRPIGQGCFYTALFRLHRNTAFSLVYDCGSDTSQSRLQEEIDQFSRELDGRSLDLLVISHLDADHVNGVGELLRVLGGVQTVFLPYLSPEERVLYAVRHAGQSDEYYRLLADPVAFLRENGAKQIFLVAPGQDDDNGGAASNPNPNAPREFIPHLSDTRELTPDFSGLVPDRATLDAYNSEAGAKALPDVHGVTDTGNITLSALWKLRLFQKEGFCPVLAAKSTPSTATSTPEQFWAEFAAALAKVLAPLPATATNILALIGRGEKLEELKDAYRRIARAHNEVSLCLWHGPVAHSGVIWGYHASGVCALHALIGHLPPLEQYWHTKWWANRPHVQWEGEEPGTLLTGDLKINGATLDRLRKHYTNELPETGMVQIPHHGSRENSAADQGLYRKDQVLFLSAGLRNRHTHPHLDLLEEINDALDAPTIWSHERRGAHFRIHCV